MNPLKENIDAYEKIKEQLEAQNMGKWVLFSDAKLISTYDSFESAAEEAVKKFGAGPYLIKQIGATSVTLPASLMYHPQYVTS